jgi:hypothetical protein
VQNVDVLRVRDPLQAAHAGTPHGGRHHRGSDDRNVDIRHFAIHRLAGANTAQGNIRLTGRKERSSTRRPKEAGAHTGRGQAEDEARRRQRAGTAQATGHRETRQPRAQRIEMD